MFVVIWEFTVHPQHRAVFERAYGPDGDWVRLFRRAAGYVATDLLRDAERPGVYLTLDRWRQPDDYVAAMASLASEYQGLDQRCAQYTAGERRIGSYVEG